MKNKPTWLTYFNNTIAFLLLSIFRIFLKPKKNGKNLLLINTGQIGDLIISSVIFQNFNLLKQKYDNVFLLVKEEYKILVESYRGIKIIGWNYKKYKYNIYYRLRFLLSLRKKSIKDCFNLTAARGITVDELSILSGAENIYALNSNFKYLTKLFGTITDKMYSEILAKDIVNEYDKNLSVFECLNINDFEKETTLNIDEKYLINANVLLNSFKNSIKIVVSPYTEINVKNWGEKNYYKLFNNILKYNAKAVIFLIGTLEKRSSLEKLATIDKNRIINFSGKLNILESAAIVYHSNIFIGNDSGFTHIAKALKKPFIGIIGGGSYKCFFPYSIKKNERYLYHNMDCFGCEWRCIHEKPYCLTKISVDEVLKNVYELLHK